MQPNGNDPQSMVGWIPDQYSAKVKTYLGAAKAIILNDQTAQVIKGLLAQGNDPAMALATFIGKTVDSIETKLGPLSDQEHDQVCMVIAGWLASTMQNNGMPGMEDAGARQDFIGRVLQALDGLTKGDAGQGAPEAQAPQEAAPEQQAPLGQFGGPQ